MTKIKKKHGTRARLTWHMAMIGLALAAASTLMGQTGSRVSQTRHNMTASGPGPIRVAGTSEVCIFCHTPHAANPIGPLWNRNDPGHYYQVYHSSTLVATVGQPTGDSRLCLSCHDGTIALTQLHNPRSAPASTVYITPQDTGYIGTDLTSHHPISFVYDSALAAKNPQLRDPGTLPSTLPLDRQRQLQCTTCHDAHDDSLGFFLRMDNRESALCVRCHDMTGWTLSIHATSATSVMPIKAANWNRLRVSTVRDLGCEGCHKPHGAGGRERLLRFATEEDNCLVCHNGSVGKDVASALVKVSTHPVRRTTGVHDPNENPLAMATHVECADCHNPHAIQTGPASKAPMVKAVNKGATGVNSFGRAAGPARFEYEICYKCHSSRNPARELVNRVIPQNDIAQAFSQSNASFHPIEVQGRNMDVPSLLQPMLTSTQIYCTDCHNSDTAGRGGVAGPHGSAFAPLLTRNYTTTDNTPESTVAYDLCYACHNRASILGNQTFSKHSLHIVDQRAPCSVCHDSHGVLQNARLINFDRFVVKPTKAGLGPTYTSSGLRKGSCTLSCHGKDHNAKQYP